MTVPIYMTACFCTLLCAYSSDRLSERGFHITGATFVATAGYILLIITRQSSLALRYISLVICSSGVHAVLPVLLIWPASTIGGHTKRGTTLGLIQIAIQAGGVVGGQIYRNNDGNMSSWPLFQRVGGVPQCSF